MGRITDRIDLYRARYRRFRAERGTPEWHEATAEIRAFAGDQLSAFAHRLAGTVKRALSNVIDGLADMVKPYLEQRDAVVERTAETEAVA